MPEGLFAVKMYALTTDPPKRVHKNRSKVQANRPRVIKWGNLWWTSDSQPNRDFMWGSSSTNWGHGFKT